MPAALIMALALAATDAAPPAETEPLPPGAPHQDYPLAAWCYGALSEFLDVYEVVKPDLIKIDKTYGSSVPNEKEPYAADIKAYRTELKVLAHAVQAAEQASPSAIAPQGLEALNQGKGIWRPTEMKTRRELARAWLSWTLPDRCDSNAHQLIAKSALLGQALKANNPSALDAAKAPETPPAAPTPASASADPAPAAAAPPSKD